MNRRGRAPSKVRGLPPFVPFGMGLGVLGLALLVFGADIGTDSYQLILALALGGVALVLVVLASVQWLQWRDE
jgi:hypothetical protein